MRGLRSEELQQKAARDLLIKASASPSSRSSESCVLVSENVGDAMGRFNPGAMQKSAKCALRHFMYLNSCSKVSRFSHHRARLSTEAAEVAGTSAGTKQDDMYDVVIVGGGMVGAAVGCGLANDPMTSALRIAIIDGNTMDNHSLRDDTILDPRVSAITPTTVAFFKDVGAWEQVTQSRHSPFNSMQVWDYTGLAYTRYKAEDLSESALGYVVENKVLLSALQSRLQLASVEMICPAKVEDVNFQCSNALPSRSTAAPSWAKVQLDNGRRLQTRLVIGADGGRSKVRNIAGIDTTGWKYNQQAVICTIGVETEHFTAWQRFLPTGPLALLPLGGKFSNIVWSTTPEKAESLKSLTSEQFVNAVNRALTEDYGPKPQSGSVHHLMSKILSPFTGGSTPSVEEDFMFPPKVISLESQRLSFPLSLSHANKYVAHRLALVGDAAHTVHPLAGQGVNLGFGDAASIANILSEAITFGEDIGERSVLQRYEKERMSANVLMMAILDGFQRVFSVDFGPFNLVRAGGFSTVQNFGPLKKLITSYAMGKSVHM